jgi:hypothetical protein
LPAQAGSSYLGKNTEKKHGAKPLISTNGVMDVYSKTPDERALLFIEWHARLIPNPVRRLRYLRMAMRVAP